jgi:hypothetical protein
VDEAPGQGDGRELLGAVVAEVCPGRGPQGGLQGGELLGGGRTEQGAPGIPGLIQERGGVEDLGGEGLVAGGVVSVRPGLGGLHHLDHLGLEQPPARGLGRGGGGRAMVAASA